MRSTKGLELLCSELFYDNQLKPGLGTNLDDPIRALSRTWLKKIGLLYPSLMPCPVGLAYPVFIYITSDSAPETDRGTIRVNRYNISMVIDHVIWILESEIATTADIGISTPYAAQVNLYHETMIKLSRVKPDYDWSSVRIGTTEWFHGRETDYMTIDLV